MAEAGISAVMAMQQQITCTSLWMAATAMSANHTYQQPLKINIYLNARLHPYDNNKYRFEGFIWIQCELSFKMHIY